LSIIRLKHGITYYAFCGVLAPMLGDIVPAAVFPSANSPLVVTVPRTKMLAASFPPAQRNSWYETKSVRTGAVPESAHATCRVPAGFHDPAMGLVNETSANVVVMSVLTRKRGTRLGMRIM